MKNKAFTLIELLVVIAILGLVLSIVIVHLGGAREGARIAPILQYEASLHRLLGPDIVGWWNFNHGVDSSCGARKVCDISGKGNHGSIYSFNEIVYNDGVPGKSGYAIEFDGSDDYIRINPFNELSGSTGFTISFWLKIRTEQGSALFRPNSFLVHSGMTAPPGEYLARFHLDGEWRSEYTWPYVIDRWGHIVLTWDGINTRIYQDTIMMVDSTADSAYNAMTNDNDWWLRVSSMDNDSLDGFIDDLRI